MTRPESRLTDLDRLSPSQLKDELIAAAKDSSHHKAATHQFLNAGRGNPNWVATTAREAFLLLGHFAIDESKRRWDEPDVGGMPVEHGSAHRLREFLARAKPDRGRSLLERALAYGVADLGFDADAFVHELCDGIIGDNYPEPDRMLSHAEQIVQCYLAKTMCDDRPPPGAFRLFATEGGTAAMCYVFKSLAANKLLKPGDTIALGAPIFTPYLELPKLYGLDTVSIVQNTTAGGRHAGQYTEGELAKLEDPRVKAFLIVNPSNPASFALAEKTQQQLVRLVREKRRDLLIISDDVYGTFAPGFRSLAADLPHNTILVYSYSKHFGCTGWRLGVVAMHEEHEADRALARLSDAERSALSERYSSLVTDPSRLGFIDRMVADSRDVALNHSAGLSTPQQVQMVLFSLFALLDQQDEYQNRCRAILSERFTQLMHGLGIALTPDPLRVGYYADLDLGAWGRRAIGSQFADYVASHDEPVELVLALARRSGTVLLDASGFDGSPWTVRVSLANLDAEDYRAIGADLRAIAEEVVARWRQTRSK